MYVQIWSCIEGVQSECGWFDMSSLTFAATPGSATSPAVKKPCGGGSDPVSEAIKAGWSVADVMKLVKELRK